MHSLAARLVKLLEGNAVERLRDVYGRVRFQLEDGAFTLDLQPTGCQVVDTVDDVRVTIRLDADVLSACLDGERDPRVASRRREILFVPGAPESVAEGRTVLYKLCELAHLTGELAGSPVAQLYDRLRPEDYATSVSSASARMLYQLVRAQKPKDTLEIGFARGVSAVAIGIAAKNNGNAARHVVIDPYQHSLFAGAGLQNVERAGIAESVTLLPEPDYVALPKLVSEQRRFQFVFVDGNHMIDHAFLEVFYADRLLDVGGLLVLDDVHLQGVDEVVRYLLERRAGSYEPLRESCNERLTTFRKVSEDVRTPRDERRRMAPGRRIF